MRTKDVYCNNGETKRRTQNSQSLLQIDNCPWNMQVSRRINPLLTRHRWNLRWEASRNEKKSVSYPQIDSPADRYDSEVTQSNSSIEAHMYGSSPRTILTSVDLTTKCRHKQLDKFDNLLQMPLSIRSYSRMMDRSMSCHVFARQQIASGY